MKTWIKLFDSHVSLLQSLHYVFEASIQASQSLGEIDFQGTKKKKNLIKSSSSSSYGFGSWNNTKGSKFLGELSY